jgi:hypothetical protein
MTLLTRAELEAMTDRDRSLRVALWRQTVARLGADHERRYHAPMNRLLLNRDAS